MKDERNCFGDFLINDETEGSGVNWFCHTLEDELRADGQKVYGKTCIPAGPYKVMMTWSPKYKRMMPLVWNHIDEKGVRCVIGVDGKGNEAKWTGIRLHGGNDEDDSLGCPLIGFKGNGKDIWQQAGTKLNAKLEEGVEYDLLIENKIFGYEGQKWNK